MQRTGASGLSLVWCIHIVWVICPVADPGRSEPDHARDSTAGFRPRRGAMRLSLRV
jgi:hypothetical protein